MKITVSNTLAAKLLWSVVFLSRLPNPIVVLRFFSITQWSVHFSFFDQSFFANLKYNT